MVRSWSRCKRGEGLPALTNPNFSFIKHHLGVAGPEEDDSETLRLELTDLQKKYEQLLAENKDLRNRVRLLHSYHIHRRLGSASCSLEL